MRSTRHLIAWSGRGWWRRRQGGSARTAAFPPLSMFFTSTLSPSMWASASSVANVISLAKVETLCLPTDTDITATPRPEGHLRKDYLGCNKIKTRFSLFSFLPQILKSLWMQKSGCRRMVQGKLFMLAPSAITARSCEKMLLSMWSADIWTSAFPVLTSVETHFAVEQNWGPTLSPSTRQSN